MLIWVQSRPIPMGLSGFRKERWSYFTRPTVSISNGGEGKCYLRRRAHVGCGLRRERFNMKAFRKQSWCVWVKETQERLTQTTSRIIKELQFQATSKDTANDMLSETTKDCCSTDNGTNTSDVSSMDSPTKTTNRIIALTSAAAAVGLFLATRGGFSGVTLGELAATALPYEEALANGRPTVVEFYADWCEVCREMAPDVYKVEQQYKDEVNFVMLNVDNTKWEQELDEFGVEGIPHFAFLDKEGNEEGNIVGRLPKKYLEDNVLALSKGEEKLPHSRVVGQYSKPELHQAPHITDPRSHGA